MIGFGQEKGCIEGNCKDGVGTFIYDVETDDRYVGEWEDGKRHGKGTQYHWLFRYVGDWKNDEYNGIGTLNSDELIDGIYTGSWKDGKRHGKGELISNSFFHYKGEWKNGNRHGEGIGIHYLDPRANASQSMKEKSIELAKYLEVVSIKRHFYLALIKGINHGFW
jgi:hypothetical protein